MTFMDFSVDEKSQYAVIRSIEIIGEASKNVPIEIRNKLPDIPWQKLRGIRNRIVHDYFDVDRTIIWHIVSNELSILKKSLQQYL